MSIYKRKKLDHIFKIYKLLFLYCIFSLALSFIAFDVNETSK